MWNFQDALLEQESAAKGHKLPLEEARYILNHILSQQTVVQPQCQIFVIITIHFFLEVMKLVIFYISKHAQKQIHF